MRFLVFVLSLIGFCYMLYRLSVRTHYKPLPVDDPIPPPPDLERPPEEAERHSSGIHSLVLAPGHGSEHPTPFDRVHLHYTGWQATDGMMFDSSVWRELPATVPMDRMIPGLREGIRLMVVGEQRRVWIPEKLAYYKKPLGPRGMLVYDLELLAIVIEDEEE